MSSDFPPPLNFNDATCVIPQDGRPGTEGVYDYRDVDKYTKT